MSDKRITEQAIELLDNIDELVLRAERDKKVADLVKLHAYSVAPGDTEDLILVDELRELYPYEEEKCSTCDKVIFHCTCK